MTPTIRDTRLQSLGIRFSLVMIIVLLVAANTAAQSFLDGQTPTGMAPGSPVGSYALSDFESVNLFNGKLNFVLRLKAAGGRGNVGYTIPLRIQPEWNIQRNYCGNGCGTDWISLEGSFYYHFDAGVYPGVMIGRQSSDSPDFANGGGCYPDPNATYGFRTQTLLTFKQPDGTEYEFVSQANAGEPKDYFWQCQTPYPTPYTRGTIWTTRDGSATFISDTAIGDTFYPAIEGVLGVTGDLMVADGTRYRIVNGAVQWIRDRNGNKLTVSPSSIKDSLNRTITFGGESVGNNTSYYSIIYTGFGGAQRTIKVWRTLLGNTFGGAPVLRSDYPGLAMLDALFPAWDLQGDHHYLWNPEVVAAVELPDGKQYKFQYNQYGELARVVLPTGGAYEYDYAGAGYQGDSVVGGAEGWLPKMVYRRVTQRRVYSDSTTLESKTSYSKTSWAQGVKVLVDHKRPNDTLLSHEEHYFYGIPDDLGASALYPNLIALTQGKEYQTDIFDSDSTTLLRRTVNTWQNRATLSWCTGCSNLIVLTQTVVTLADSNQVSKQVFEYDQYNNPTNITEYDFGNNGSAGVKVRRTRTTYLKAGYDTNTSIHLRNLPTQISIFDGNDVERARTTIEYDNYTLEGADCPHSSHCPIQPRSNISGLCDGSPQGCNGGPNFTDPNYVTRGNTTATTRYLLTNGTVTGSVTDYAQYDVAGNKVKIIDPGGNATAIAYADNFGAPDDNAILSTAPTELSSVAQYSYAFATQVTNALGHVVHSQYDYYLGALVNLQDQNGIVSSQEYGSQGLDLLDRPSRSVQGFNTSIKSQRKIVYDDVNHTITTTGDLTAYDDNLLKQQTSYDGLGRTTETRSYESATDFITSKVEFDVLGRVKRSYNPYRTTSDETYGWSEPTYDALSRVTRVQTFDRLGASTGIVQNDYLGTKVLVTDQTGNKRLNQTSVLGLTDVWEIAPSDAATTTVSFGAQSLTGYRTQYEYDSLGDLTKVTQGNQPSRVFAYNSFKQLTDATTVESGHIVYDYHATGNLHHKTDARGIVTTFEYDELNRLETCSYSDSTPQVTYSYDSATFGVGRLASVSSSVSTYAYNTYDELGRLKTTTQTTDGVGYVMNYDYNRAGQLISETYPSGRIVKSEYDTAGRVAGVRNNATGLYYAGAPASDTAQRMQYAAPGGLRTVKLGNGLWEHANYNSRGQITQIGLGTSGTDSSKLQLDYGFGLLVGSTLDTTKNNGNLQSQTITMPALTLAQTYTYDELNRLKSATEKNGTTSIWKQTYKYDRFGNRTFDTTHPDDTTLPVITTQNEATTNPSISEANNQISTSGYRYDGAGNLKCDPLHPCGPSPAYTGYYDYDAENRIKTANGGATNGGASYLYDGGGRRVKKMVGGTSIVSTVFVYDANGQLISEYGDGTPASNGTTYLTADVLGSTRITTTSAGAVVGRHDYQPYGEEIPANIGSRSGVTGYNAGDNVRQKFTQKERDLETGLDYFGARYYASGLGRFTGVDPVSITIDRLYDPQQINLYLYSRNSPLKFIDLKGEDLVLANKAARQHGLSVIYSRLRPEERSNVTVVGNRVKLVNPTAIDLSKATNAYKGLYEVIRKTNIVNYYTLNPGDTAQLRAPAPTSEGPVLTQLTYKDVQERGGGVTIPYSLDGGTTWNYDVYVVVGGGNTVLGLDNVTQVSNPEEILLYHEAMGHGRGLTDEQTIDYENAVRQDTGVPNLPRRSGSDHTGQLVVGQPELLSTPTVVPPTYLIPRPLKPPIPREP